MEIPKDEIVADLVGRLDDNLTEWFHERAALREFDALLPRPFAESLALLDILHLYPLALTGIVTLEVELDGATHWLLTTDLNYARQTLTDINVTEIAVINLSDVINDQFGGTALLTALTPICATHSILSE